MLWLQVGQTAEALNAARAEVAQAEKDAASVHKRADELTVQAGKKSAEADEYRDKWEKTKQQVSIAKSAEREHWERAKKVSSPATAVFGQTSRTIQIFAWGLAVGQICYSCLAAVTSRAT